MGKGDEITDRARSTGSSRQFTKCVRLRRGGDAVRVRLRSSRRLRASSERRLRGSRAVEYLPILLPMQEEIARRVRHADSARRPRAGSRSATPSSGEQPKPGRDDHARWFSKAGHSSPPSTGHPRSRAGRLQHGVVHERADSRRTRHDGAGKPTRLVGGLVSGAADFPIAPTPIYSSIVTQQRYSRTLPGYEIARLGATSAENGASTREVTAERTTISARRPPSERRFAAASVDHPRGSPIGRGRSCTSRPNSERVTLDGHDETW